MVNKAPFKKDDLVRFGVFEFIVFKCFKIGDNWHINGNEIHTKNPMSTAAKNCKFVNVSQGDLFNQHY